MLSARSFKEYYSSPNSSYPDSFLQRKGEGSECCIFQGTDETILYFSLIKPLSKTNSSNSATNYQLRMSNAGNLAWPKKPYYIFSGTATEFMVMVSFSSSDLPIQI